MMHMETRESDHAEAENLVKDGKVKKYIFNGVVLWVVVGKERDYLVLPNIYCSCEDFYVRVVSRMEKKYCIHLIAQKIAEEDKKYDVYRLDRKELRKIIDYLLS
ncbi:MAG: hypothetical protein DRN81_00050 [Thermoproteota archaeon]|nr:MAG: hypothetical protein DRN81_00050 [Candidatus Korarchaeota archaeon]